MLKFRGILIEGGVHKLYDAERVRGVRTLKEYDEYLSLPVKPLNPSVEELRTDFIGRPIPYVADDIIGLLVMGRSAAAARTLIGSSDILSIDRVRATQLLSRMVDLFRDGYDPCQLVYFLAPWLQHGDREQRKIVVLPACNLLTHLITSAHVSEYARSQVAPMMDTISLCPSGTLKKLALPWFEDTFAFLLSMIANQTDDDPMYHDMLLHLWSHAIRFGYNFALDAALLQSVIDRKRFPLGQDQPLNEHTINWFWLNVPNSVQVIAHAFAETVEEEQIMSPLLMSRLQVIFCRGGANRSYCSTFARRISSMRKVEIGLDPSASGFQFKRDLFFQGAVEDLKNESARSSDLDTFLKCFKIIAKRRSEASSSAASSVESPDEMLRTFVSHLADIVLALPGREVSFVGLTILRSAAFEIGLREVGERLTDYARRQFAHDGEALETFFFASDGMGVFGRDPSTF